MLHHPKYRKIERGGGEFNATSDKGTSALVEFVREPKFMKADFTQLMNTLNL